MKAIKKRVALAGAGALIIAPIWAIPAQAAPDGDNVVINEVYARGGSNNQPYDTKFIELYNPTDGDISLSGMSLQYFSASGTGAATTLDLTGGTIPAGGYFLIHGAQNNDGAVGDPLPEPDAEANFNLQGSNGSIALVLGTESISGLGAGDVKADERFIDFVGYGTSNKFETAAAITTGGNSDPGSITRTEGVDTDNNLEDFDFVDVPTPTNSAGETGGGGEEPGPDPEPVDLTIADIQGTGDTTPYNGQQVTTSGVVTAIYEDGGYNGVVIQTPGTGGEIGEASHGIFVYSRSMASDVDFGDYIEVTGQAGEYNGLTQISGNPTFTIVDEEFDAPVAAVVTPDDLATDAQREALESMLLDVSDVEFTVTDTYQTNRYGEVALAMDDAPLPTPTDVFNPVAEEAEHDALVAENYAKMLTLGDGASWDLTRFDQNNDEIPVPYLNLEVPVRVGAGAEITEPVVLDYRFQWNLQPTEWITGENDDFVVFEDTRAEIVNAPEVEGDITISTFNVLNYFSSLGADEQGCQYYEDRDGNPVTANWCDVRGAYSQEAFERQEGKIVAAINELDASIVGLEEIENSAPFTEGADRDVALRTLVAALNEDAGSEKWGYAESPEAVPATADEDVIRLAFIYQVDEVAPTADSKILLNHPDYHNAREPLGQSWKALDADGEQVGEEFATIVNHFKSKGSGTDDGTGQGNANPDRVLQANGLLEFADEEYGDMPVFLVGDFNSYNAEDPLRAFEADGYTNLLLDQSEKDGVHYFTYTFDKRIGSLDHIFADEDAYDWVLETAVWNINSPEAIGLEYSRHNYNVTNLFEADNPFRSSDHDPIIVGLDIPGFQDEDPIIVVTPEAPTFADNVIMIPEVDGVEYLIDGEVVDSGTVTITEDTTVTARALEGFELAEGATAEWTFEYVAPAPPTGNVFFFVNDWSSPQADLVISFGEVGDEIYVGDWDGDGKDTLAIRSGNTFYLHNDLVDGDADVTFKYGRVGDEVFVGDFDGDGVDTFGVRRSTTFYVQNELVGGNAELEFKYGRVGDEILIGDWDGDDKDTIMVRRDKTYFANNTLVGGNAETEFHYGRSGDEAFAGDFDGDNKDSLVLRRGNVFYINNQLVGGNADSTIGYGRASDHVMIGDWDGDGIDTPAVNRVVR